MPRYSNMISSFIMSLLMHVMLGVCLEVIWMQLSRVTFQPLPEFKIGNSSVVFTVLPRTEIQQNARKIEPLTIPIQDLVEEKDALIEEQILLPHVQKPEEIKTERIETHSVTDNDKNDLPPVPETPLKDTGVVAELDLSKTVLRPRYPLSSRFRGEEGDVIVRVEVNNEGGVKKVEIIKSSGFSALDSEAVKSVRKAKFFTSDGRVAHGGEAKISFKFRLVEHSKTHFFNQYFP